MEKNNVLISEIYYCVITVYIIKGIHTTFVFSPPKIPMQVSFT